MGKEKGLMQRLEDLKAHASLLKDACDRFYANHNLNETINIGRGLRLLVCPGRGNNLLFNLSKELDPQFHVYVLKRYISLKVSEIDPKTNKVIQEVEKKQLWENSIPGQPRLPIITLDVKFNGWLKKVNFEEWLESGFLISWEIPNDTGGTPKIKHFTPRKLIKCYADTEASHADDQFAKEFGCSVDKLKEKYKFNNKIVEIPVIYNYLYQIGKVTAALGLNLYKEQNK